MIKKHILNIHGWLLSKLSFGRPIAMNLKLLRGLYLEDVEKGYFNNITINYEEDLPEGYGFYGRAKRKG